MKEMKTRKTYERPSMRVVELKRKPALLVGSGNGADSLSPFAPGSDPLNPEP